MLTSSPEMQRDSKIRSYRRTESIVFLKTNETFGGLSNMAGGFPLKVNGIRILTSEALYQACRFPNMPEVQRLIIAQASPMTAKMKSKPHRHNSRSDWDQVRITIMRWCLRVKLVWNWPKFSKLLLATEDRPIVEESRKDDFWGAKSADDQILIGMNILGRLLMELREEIKSSKMERFASVKPLNIRDFLLDGRPIEAITVGSGLNVQQLQDTPLIEIVRTDTLTKTPSREMTVFEQSSLFEQQQSYENINISNHIDDQSPRPYPVMKASCVPWLGEVPEHWDVRRGKWLFRHRKQINTDRANSNVLSLTLRGVVNNDPDNPEGLVPNDYATYQFFCKGDLVFKLIDLENLRTSRVGLVHEDGIMSSAYVRLAPQKTVDIRFFFQQYFDLYQRGIYNQLGAGVRSTLGPTDLLDLSVVVPPLPEQAAIVRYLDYMDRRIRKYIRAKRKLIKLLEEQKQAIIHRAVTRGLDPNVLLKPSGVEWLGDIPEHWGITRLKFIASDIIDCLHATPVYSEKGEYPAIRTADVKPGQLLLESSRRVDEDYYRRWTARMAPVEGDILYTREGERFGIAALVPADVRLCISQRMMAFRIHPNHNSAYVMWQINCRHVYAQAAGDLIGAAAPHVNVNRIKNFWLTLPPRAEQDEIMATVKQASRQPNAVIQSAKHEIALLREYRTRLIADVVTGKLDVREAVAQLPDEAAEPELVDEGDAMSAIDEEPVDDLDTVQEEVEA